ncbi:BMC domain-containing protein [uncultured Acetobacterium sp.]|uniref:BMC domain-containing protein n=1 Tax=uncultured Acetobacterium sp. TaxID=217139 RepID=UPI0025DD37C4|nr:BMC domain-containing protein [uncultured Acetobacterium sp.]
MISVGIIDTVGFTGAVTALDTCLKTADVEFVRYEKMSGGIVSIIIKGDVGAVSASVMAGIEAAAAVGEYRKHTIIARLDDQTEKLLGQLTSRSDQEPSDQKASDGSDATIAAEGQPLRPEAQVLFDKTTDPVPSPIDQGSEVDSEVEANEELTAAASEALTDEIKEPKDEPLIYSEEALNVMTVSQLRRLARELSIKGISREKIKRSRKVDLVVNILKELSEEEE